MKFSVMSLSTASMTGLSTTTESHEANLRHFSNTGLVDFASAPNFQQSSNTRLTISSSPDWQAVVPVETNNDITVKFTPCNSTSDVNNLETSSANEVSSIKKTCALTAKHLAKMFVTGNHDVKSKVSSVDTNTQKHFEIGNLKDLESRLANIESNLMKQTELICEQDLGLHEHTAIIDKLIESQNDSAGEINLMKTGLLNHKNHIEMCATGLLEHKDHIESMHAKNDELSEGLLNHKTSIEAHNDKLSKMHAGLKSHKTLLDDVTKMHASIKNLQNKQTSMHKGLENHSNFLKNMKQENVAQRLDSLDQKLQQRNNVQDNLHQMQLGMNNHTSVLRQLRDDSEKHAAGLMNHKSLIAELRAKV